MKRISIINNEFSLNADYDHLLDFFNMLLDVANMNRLVGFSSR